MSYSDRRIFKIIFMGAGQREHCLQGGGHICFRVVSFFGPLRFGGWAWIVFAAVFLCMAADIWIQYSLIPGVLVFLSAHIFYITWIVLSGGMLGWNLLLSCVVCGCLLWLYRRHLKSFGAQSIGLSIYLLILLCMVSTAISLPFAVNSLGAWIVLSGALLFVSSDLILGASIVTGRKSGWKDKAIMLLYEPAVFLLALSPFYI